MSYSRLTNKYIVASPNNYMRGRGGYKVCKITPHHMACLWSAERCAQSFQVEGRMASANYCIGSDGTIVCNVDEENRAWTSSNYYNDCQSITIEVANETCAPNWTISTKAWNALVNLCVDICKRYGFRLNYTGNANGSLTEHRMFASTSCPGPFLHDRMNQLAKEVNARLDGSSVNVSTPTATPKPTCKYGVGSKVTANTLWTQSQGGRKVTGKWSGTITRVIAGTEHPYLLNNGTGWTNDAGISSGASVSNVLTKEAIDQILHVGSYVTSVHMKIGNQGLKNINGCTCAYLAPLGGWFPCSMVSKVPYSDGYNDQVLHTTNAVVYLDRVRVDAVNVQTDTVRINGVWVKAGPLTEIE